MFENSGNKPHKRVSEFYDGKSLLLTGAGGFLGTVLLEILLRCLPGIKNIFILLRSKKGVHPKERKKLIFQKRIFCKLLEEDPKAQEKVIAIEGDTALPNLGMSDEDIVAVSNEVTIIFHAAATISFIKPLRYIAMHNCLSLKNVIELARKLRKLEALIYTSTAFSNCNRHPEIEEYIYRLPWKADRFVKALECAETNEFEKLFADCKPEWPNYYCFCKCLSENIIADMANDLPVVIVRPSIICTSWNGPLRGYVEEGSSIVDFALYTVRGVTRVCLADEKSRFELIPVDIVANAHVVAAWSVATERIPTTSVINCTGGPWNVTFGLFTESVAKVAFNELIPKSFQKPSLVVVKNVYLYKLLALYEHYLPAFVFDVILSLKGSKLRLVKLYKFLDLMMEETSFFAGTTYTFRMENFYALTEQLDPIDKEIFSMNLDDLDFEEMIRAVPNANPYLDWAVTDRLSPKKRKQVVLRRTLAVYFIKSVVLMLLCFLLYQCLYFIFSLISFWLQER